MKKVKISFSTPYADYTNINGYVYAVYSEVCDVFFISKKQLNRAKSKLTIANVRPCFHTDKIVIDI